MEYPYKHDDEETPLVVMSSKPSPAAKKAVLEEDTQNRLCHESWHTWWKTVLFCAINVALAAWLVSVQQESTTTAHHWRLEDWVGSSVHRFSNYVVALTVVSKVGYSLKRFNDAHVHFAAICAQTRQLAQAVLSSAVTDTERRCASWRSKVTYRALMFLRATVAVLLFQETCVAPWHVPEIGGVALESIRQYARVNNMQRGSDEELEESLRVPIYASYLLRRAIAAEGSKLPKPLPVEREAHLLDIVDSMVGEYHALEAMLVTSPRPFILTETTRTFLFLYVFTLPMALGYMIGDDVACLVAYFFSVVFTTSFFVGIELLSVSMDYPFRDKGPSLVNYSFRTMAQQTCEDVYLMTLDAVGSDSTHQLRYTMNDRLKQPISRENSWIFRCPIKIDFPPDQQSCKDYPQVI